ncbi:MAG TPA: hypothetical protein DEV59_11620 [Proteus sp.]|nr:hypothetical protein [Proteus sp. (in: enterobacteria)]
MKKTLLSALITALLVTGCGGSSDGDSNNGGDNGGGSTPATLTGQFIDSAVQGIDFKTSTKQGTTNATGEFVYRNGEEVTFTIGDLGFPSATASAILTPLELAGTQDASDPEVINMVRLLMTLDTDGNPDNGISIPSQAKEVATPVDFNVSVEEFATSPDVLNLVTNAGQQTPVTELVSEEEANAHFQESLDDIAALDTYADYVGMFNLEADDPNYDGSYTGIMNIYPDGSYLMVEYYRDDSSDTGLEYGYLNLKDGNFNPDILVDTNSPIYAGLSGGDFSNVYMDGNTLHLTKTEQQCDGDPEECTYSMTTPKVTIAGNTIVGSWETSDGFASYNFRDDGNYYLAQVKDPAATSGEGDIGIEIGQYNFDSASSTLTMNVLSTDSDTSGASLLADNGVSYDIHSSTLSADGQTLTLIVDYNDDEDTALVLTRKL